MTGKLDHEEERYDGGNLSDISYDDEDDSTSRISGGGKLLGMTSNSEENDSSANNTHDEIAEERSGQTSSVFKNRDIFAFKEKRHFAMESEGTYVQELFPEARIVESRPYRPF